jgi:hypothetical protein
MTTKSATEFPLSPQVRRTAILLFFALTACYLALAPGTITGRGYIGEEMNSGNQMMAVFNAWFKGRPVPSMLWSRHGPVPVLFDIPFLKLGKLFLSQDFMMSLEPILLTAGTMVLVFLWLRKIASPQMSLLITLSGAFATMMWPYAYIGLETKQSFFVLLAGYLALANGRIRSWPGLIGFGITAGLSLTVKGTGIVMWPAMVYLVYAQCRGRWSRWRIQAAVAVVLIVGVWAIGNATRNFYWTPLGGGLNNMRGWMTDSPILIFSNVVGLFGSPSKGLAIYAPILIVCIYAIPRAFRTVHRDLTVFAFLIMACTMGLISLLIVTSDEVWGPRYMHVAIAPLLVCIGAAWPRMDWKIGLTIGALAAVGLALSFLGAFSYYGESPSAMEAAGQNTMEWINGDPVWIGPVFEARLVRTWLRTGNNPVPWTTNHVWVWTPPKDAPKEWKTINLREYATPQSVLLQNWHTKLEGTNRTIFRLALLSLIAGPFLMIWAAIRNFKSGL